MGLVDCGQELDSCDRQTYNKGRTCPKATCFSLVLRER